jgi:hypothetical protein
MLDCPSVRCKARFADNHTATSRAFVKHVEYRMMGLMAIFPSKVNETYNRNVLVSFESAARYQQLKAPDFYVSAHVDLHASHIPDLPVGMKTFVRVCMFMFLYVCTLCNVCSKQTYVMQCKRV